MYVMCLWTLGCRYYELKYEYVARESDRSIQIYIFVFLIEKKIRLMAYIIFMGIEYFLLHMSMIWQETLNI